MIKPLEWLKGRFFHPPDDKDLFLPAPDLENIPESYLRRFDLSPVQEPGQVVGRRREKEEKEKNAERKELGKIEQARANWKAYKMPLLLVAEPGVGVTSLLNAAMPLLEPCSIVEDRDRISNNEALLETLKGVLEVADADSLASLAQVQLEAPRVVIFENVERLLLRRIGGYDLLRDFLHFINATRASIFWIVTINDYSLYFLNRAMKFADNFVTIKVKPLGKEEIREIILNRNKGFEMIFLKPETLTQRYKLQLARMSSEERQASLEEHFFEELLQFADGNISRAMVFWLSAVKAANEVKVHLKEPHIPKPQDVSLEELLVLEAVFQHTSLSLDEVDEVFRYSSYNGRLVLDRLVNRGWLYPRKIRSGVQEYQVNFWYLHQLKRFFKEKLNRNMP